MRGLKLLVLFFSRTFAEIGFTDLVSIKYTNADGITAPLPMLGKDSLFEGVLLHQIGALHNLRFFSPYTTRAFEETTSWYKADPVHDSPDLTSGRSTDPTVMEKEKLAYVLCRLFPSQTGTISIVANNPRNLTYILKTLLIEQDKKDRKDLKMLAGILFCLMHKGSIERGVFSGGKGVLKLKISTNTHSVEYTASLTDKGSTGIWDDRINMLKALITITNDPTDRIFDSGTIFKAYLAIYLEDKDSLEHFYKEYFALFEKLGINLTEQVTKDYDGKIKKILSSVENELSKFPYKPNSAPSYRSMSFYLGNDQFASKGAFSTCSESALYHLCNCVLWDADDKAYINVFDKNNELSILNSKIFSGQMKGIPDDIEMRKWHKLIENLPEGVCCNREGFKTYDSIDLSSQKVFYVKDQNYTENGKTNVANNEVEPGLINFVRLLEILTGNEGNLVPKILPIFAKDRNNSIDLGKTAETLKSKVLNGCLKDMFKVIVGSDNIKYFGFNFQGAEVINCNGRYDIYGNLTITREYKRDIFISYSLYLSPDHAKLSILNFTAKPANLDEDAVASFLTDYDYGIDLKLAFYTYLSKYMVNESTVADFLDKVDVGMRELSHLYLVGRKMGPDEDTKELINKLLTPIYKDELSHDETQSNILRSVEYLLKSIPIDDPATFKQFNLATFLLRDRLRTVPIVMAAGYRYTGHELVDSIKMTYFNAHTHAAFLTSMFEKITVALNYEFSKRNRDPSMENCVRFGDQDSHKLSEDIKDILTRFKKATSDRISEFSVLRDFNLNILMGLFRNIIHFLHTYNFFIGKIERKEMLTKHEYFHFLETIFGDSSDMFHGITDLVLNDHRTLKSLEELRSQDTCLFEGLQILAYAKREELSKCEAIIKVDTPQNQNILAMILFYDTFCRNSGVKEYLVEKQESPAAKNQMLEFYKENYEVYFANICSGPDYERRRFLIAVLNKAELLLNAIRSYIWIFSTTKTKMEPEQLKLLVESLKGTFKEITVDFIAPAEIEMKLPLLKSRLNSLYEYLTSETIDLWKGDQDEKTKCKQALDDAIQKSGGDFFLSSIFFFNAVLDYIKKEDKQ